MRRPLRSDRERAARAQNSRLGEDENVTLQVLLSASGGPCANDQQSAIAE
jgi:hypothetical protein